MIERQNTGIAARNKILDLSVWGLQEKDDSDEGGKLGIVHSAASQIITGSSLSGLKSRKKHSPRRRERCDEMLGGRIRAHVSIGVMARC